MQSAVLMGSVGSFFIKGGQKTIIEQLGDEIKQIEETLGEREKKQVDPMEFFENFMQNFKAAKRKR